MEWPLTNALRPWTPRSRLLELPPELRDSIFEFALASEKTLVTFRLDSYQRDSLQEAIQPALTRVSRQVRQETLPIWFGNNAFVLHTEDAKARDAHGWLTSNERHIPKLKHLSLWVRYITSLHDQTSQGALSLSITPHRDQDVGAATPTVVWKVQDHWEWITVVRKHAALESDAQFLIRQLRVLLAADLAGQGDAEGLYALLVNLRTHYHKEKTSMRR